MGNNIASRIEHLRNSLQESNVQYLIAPTSDPHLSEYVASHWKSREWISGFTGSAGTVVFSLSEAGLWTDSRYFLQAEEQLSGSGILLYKENTGNTPSIYDWICSRAKEGECVGIDGSLFSANEVERMCKRFREHHLTLKTDIDFIGPLWRERPALPDTELFYLDEDYSGETLPEKWSRIRTQIQKAKADALLITALDEVAWCFNLRASDVEYNPVAIAYAILTNDSATLFTDCSRITPKARAKFLENGIELRPYDTIYKVLKSWPEKQRIMMDKEKVNYALTSAICHTESIVSAPSPIALMKSIKNETEQKGIRNAVVKDGVALSYAFRWLERMVEEGHQVTELSFAQKLHECRSQQKDFFCESFGTIAGYGQHGAIVHYSATEESNAEIGKEGLLLVDSGGNYFDGTTDITRTVILGDPTPQQKKDYTNVLKGHIALANAHFPQGTRGAQLDVLARQFLWDSCEDYGHGTGHGIGHFLCVHEGPQNIRTRDNGTELQAGMLISDEPGLYKKGQYGIRIENMVMVQEYANDDEFGKFLQMETVTLFPYDTKLIETSLLTEKERNWINQYHQKVYDKIAPLLDEETRIWLSEKVKTI